MEDTRKNIIYTCYSETNAEEYQNMAVHFPSLYWRYVLSVSLYMGIVMALACIFYQLSIQDSMVCLLTDLVLTLVICKFNLKNAYKNAFLRMQKKVPADTTFYNEFYEEYFIRRSEHVIRKIEYYKIVKIVETNSNLYLYDGEAFYILQKKECDESLCMFLREKCGAKRSMEQEEKYYYVENGSNTTQKRDLPTCKNLKLTQLVLNILFVLTIISLFGALYTWMGLTENIHSIRGVEYTWAFWLWLPVPVLSIILGLVFERKGLRCVKNIVAGVIVGGLCLIYGSFWMIFPGNEADYQQIFAYEEITNVNLPEEGELTIVEYDSYFDDMKNYKEVNTYYEEAESQELAEQIKQNENWVQMENLSSKMSIFIPTNSVLTDDTYISIYNISSKAYNTLPEETGVYRMCVMTFDESANWLKIMEFDYSYVK